MTAAALAGRVAALCEENPDADADAVRRVLVAAGATAAEADDAVLFVPLAFGHAVADRCGLAGVLSPAYSVRRPGTDRWDDRPLSGRPSFAAGQDLAARWLAAGRPVGDLLAVARRSPDFAAVYDSLQTGNPVVQQALAFSPAAGDPDLLPAVFRNARASSGCCLLIAAPLAAAGVWIVAREPGDVGGWLVTAFMGGLSLLFLAVAADSRPRLVVDAGGVTDRRLSAARVPWADVEGVRLVPAGGAVLLSLRLRNPAAYLRTVGPARRLWLALVRLARRTDPVALNVGTLDAPAGLVLDAVGRHGGFDVWGG